MALVEIADIVAASERIDGYVVRTPTVHSAGLSDAFGVPTTLKLEQLQRTGSFKARGVASKLLTLRPQERAAGVVTVSGGNHGIATAVLAGALDVKATVVMPRTAPARSVEIAERAGATVRLTEDVTEAFAVTTQLQDEGLVLVHPFADPIVLAGQGTVGLELAEDVSGVTDVLVSIGGGALISGVAVALRVAHPHVRIWGVETEGADAMSRALAAGGPTPIRPTSIVSTLSPPTVSELTYEHVSALVDEVLVVSDADAVQGTIEMADLAKVWAEPAAGCLLAAARQVIARTGDLSGLALVVCGGNTTVPETTRWASQLGLLTT